MTHAHFPAETSPPLASPSRVRVWDLPTRLFHWLLLACVTGLFATAYAPGDWIAWHARLGYCMLTLLLFRVVWGLVGGYWSRFASFVPRPGGPLPLGHSPQGALAVIVILLVLVTQVATGLVGDDEIAFTGPLNRWVSTDLGLAATAWHKGVGQWLLVGLIALHLMAITFYAVVRRNNLVGPMVRGDAPLPVGADLAQTQTVVASVDTGASRLRALWVLALCAGAVYSLVRFS